MDPILGAMTHSNPRPPRRPHDRRILKRIFAHPVVTLFLAPFTVGLLIEWAKACLGMGAG